MYLLHKYMAMFVYQIKRLIKQYIEFLGVLRAFFAKNALSGSARAGPRNI